MSDKNPSSIDKQVTPKKLEEIKSSPANLMGHKCTHDEFMDMVYPNRRRKRKTPQSS